MGHRASTTQASAPTFTPASNRASHSAARSRPTSRASAPFQAKRSSFRPGSRSRGDEPMSATALERMPAGLSTRRSTAGLEPVAEDLDQTGTAQSSVSRRFVARIKAALQELMAKPVGAEDRRAVPSRSRIHPGPGGLGSHPQLNASTKDNPRVHWSLWLTTEGRIVWDNANGGGTGSFTRFTLVVSPTRAAAA